jgi:hypothetical protein
MWHEETVFLAALRPPINFKMERLTQNKPAATPGSRKRKVLPKPDEPTNVIALLRRTRSFKKRTRPPCLIGSCWQRQTFARQPPVPNQLSVL